MKLSFPISGSPDTWAELARPEVLVASLPGCRSATPGPDGLRLVVDVAVASVRGLWAGALTGTGEGAWRIVGSGEPGHVDLVLGVDPDRTTLTVEGTVDGPLAAIGSALLAAAVRRLAEDTLARAGR
ncbi:MAG TPA: SRPBCC domain-containing protein [Acidimicrobiales bacterium]|nr:SRPBCC domain-containing protein [Acidimicrobiales bacterium]